MTTPCTSYSCPTLHVLIHYVKWSWEKENSWLGVDSELHRCILVLQTPQTSLCSWAFLSQPVCPFLALNPVTHHRIVRSSNPNMSKNSKTEVARLLLWALFEMPIPWRKWWVKGGQLLPLSILWHRDNQFETKWHKPDQPNPTCLLGESGKRRMSSTKHGKSCKSMITQPPHDKKNLKWHRCRQLPTKKLLLGWQWFSWNLLQCYLIIYSPADSHRN